MAVEFSHVAPRLASQRPIVQVMFFGEQPVKLRALVFLEQSEVDALQNVGFVGNGWKSHLTNFRQEFSKVQSFVVPPCPAAILPFQMKQPCVMPHYLSLSRSNRFLTLTRQYPLLSSEP